LFTLRLRDASSSMVDEVAIPVETAIERQPRVIVLAGAPSPETKYLRRWAEESGIDLGLHIELGGGVTLGDHLPLSQPALNKADVVVIDDRRWETLGGGAKAAIVSAVNRGLGLLLRPTGALSPATRRDWSSLGLPVSDGDEFQSVRLAPDSLPSSNAADADTLPGLSRHNLTQEGPRSVSLIRDASGIPLASWTARGLGRVGIWTVADSYLLVLGGRADRHGELWSSLFSALARGIDGSRAEIDGFARAGDRIALCRLVGRARAIGSDGEERVLHVDPASGEKTCAAYWPQRDGWHLVRDGQGRETPFFVRPSGAGSALTAAANREATLALSGIPVRRSQASEFQRTPGSPWPSFTLLLPILALLWWFERRRTHQATRHIPDRSQNTGP
jgi:hypothetical protein